MNIAISKIKCLDNQNGIALITVIMATALVAILAVSMTFAQHIDIRRTTNLLEGDKALVLALGLEEWGRQVIKRDQGNNDHLGEDWALGLMPIATDNGIVSGSIVDLQGKINLNNLDDDPASPSMHYTQTRNLLGRLFVFCEVEDNSSAVEALVDWIDTNDDQTGFGGAEDNEYLLHDPPYLAGNRPMKSPSELLLVEGVTPDNYACLKEHITALPGVTGTDININTAGAVVIAMIGHISIDDATDIVSGRPVNGYNGVNGFLAEPKLAGSGISADGLGVDSNYFMAQGQATFGEAEIGLYSLIDRSSFPVKVVSRSIGTY